MKYYINNKEVSFNLTCKYAGILLFCSTWEEHNIEKKEKYIVGPITSDEEKIIEKELKDELLQLP